MTDEVVWTQLRGQKFLYDRIAHTNPEAFKQREEFRKQLGKEKKLALFSRLKV